MRPPEKLPVNKVFTGTIDPQLLVKAYLGMSAKARSMKPVRAEQFKPIVAARIVTVTSKIVHVLKMLYTMGRCTVAELYEGVEDKSSRVATFLAVLELTKSGRIMLNEDNTEITFNPDAPRRRKERPAQEKPAPETVPQRADVPAVEHKESPAPVTALPQAAEEGEEPKPEAFPAPESVPERADVPAVEHKEAPAPVTALPQAAEEREEPKPEAFPAPESVPERADVPAVEHKEAPAPVTALPQAAEEREVPKPEAFPAPETVPERADVPAVEHKEAPAPVTELPQAAEEREEPKPEAVKPRSVAAGKYVGAVKAASGATIALPAFAPPVYESYSAEAEAPAGDNASSAVRAYGKTNRFARRYYWGYPSAGNCLWYRRERL